MSLPSHTTLNEAGVSHDAKRETRRAERISTFVAVPASQVTCERDNLPPSPQQQQQPSQQPSTTTTTTARANHSTTQATPAMCGGEMGSNGSVAIEREASCGAPQGNAGGSEAMTNEVMREGEQYSHSQSHQFTGRKGHATRRPAQLAARRGSTGRAACTQTQQQKQPNTCASKPSTSKDSDYAATPVMSQPHSTSHVECADSASFSHTSSRSPPPSAAPTTQMSPEQPSHGPVLTPATEDRRKEEHTEEEGDGKEPKSHSASLPAVPLTSSVIVLDNSFSAATSASTASASSSLAMTRCPPCALPTTREATLGLTHPSVPSEESATKAGGEMPAHTNRSHNHTFTSTITDANTTTLLAESSKDPAVPCALAPLPTAELTEAELTSTSYSLRFSSVTSDDVRRTLARGLALGGVEFHVDLSAQSSLTTNLNTTTTTNTNTTTTMSFMRPYCTANNNNNNNNNSCSNSLCSRRGSDVRNSLSGTTGDVHAARRRTGRHMTHYLISTIEERPATTTTTNDDGAGAEEEEETGAAAAAATNSNGNEAVMTHVTVMRPVLVDESDACPRFLAARASEGACGERRLLPLYHSCRNRSLTLWLSEQQQHQQEEEEEHPPRVHHRSSEEQVREHEEEGAEEATTSAARPASSTHTHLPAAVPSLNSTEAEDGLVQSSHLHEAHASTQASETGGGGGRGEGSAAVFLRTACVPTGRGNNNGEHQHHTHVHHVMSGGTNVHAATASAAQVLPSVLPATHNASPIASSSSSSSPCETHTGHNARNNNNDNNNNGDRSDASGGSATPMLRSTAQAYITGSSLPSSLRADDTMGGMMGGSSSSQAMVLTAAEGGSETRSVERGGGGNGEGAEEEQRRRPVAGPLLHALDGPDNALLSGTAPHPLHTTTTRRAAEVEHDTAADVAITRPVVVVNTINNNTNTTTISSSNHHHTNNGHQAGCEAATAALIAPDRPRSHTPTDPFGMPVIVFPPLVVQNNNNSNSNSEGGAEEREEEEDGRARDAAEEVVVHSEAHGTAAHAGAAADGEAVFALPTPSAAGTSWSTTTATTSHEGNATARAVARHRALLRTFLPRTALHDTPYEEEEDNNNNYDSGGGHAAWATHSRTTAASSTALSPSLHSIRTTSEGRAARAAVLRAPMSPLPRVRRADGTLRTTAERRVFSRRPLPRGLLFSESSGSHCSRSTNSNDMPDDAAAAAEDEEEDEEEEAGDYTGGANFFVPPAAEEEAEGAVVRCASGLHAMLLEGREPERVGHLLRPSTSIVDRYAAL